MTVNSLEDGGRNPGSNRSALKFGLDVFCLFEARISEFDAQPHPRTTVELYSVHCILYTASNTCTMASISALQLAQIQPQHLFANLRIALLGSAPLNFDSCEYLLTHAKMPMFCWKNQANRESRT
jgi:hypothetical protein